MQRLISDIFDDYAGRPILVIGGGPSVLRDLPALPADFAPACVISANDHGTKQCRYPVTFLVNCDKVHCMLKVPMEEHLRVHCIPIMNRFSWADVRLGDWPLVGNSGLAAIGVAAALGGDPVVVTGMDFWRTGRLYFHGPRQEIAKAEQRAAAKRRIIRPRAPTRGNKLLEPLARFAKGANIRPMSGPMTEVFPQYRHGEVLPPRQDIHYRVKAAGPQDYVATRAFPWRSFDKVVKGTVLRLTYNEAAHLIREGKVARRLQGEPAAD